MKASELIQALEALWEKVQSYYPEIEDAIIVTGSSNSNIYGHFCHKCWGLKKTEVNEVFINGEVLADRELLLSTVLHEAVHALAHVREIKETSDNGIYHNKNFKRLAEGEFGLTVHKLGHHGYATVEIDLIHILAYKDELDAILNLELFRITPEEEEEKPRKPKFVCQCDPVRTIQLSKKEQENGPVFCGVCKSDFIQEEVE